ncbi:MAG: ABC transporter permease [Elusimicrobia bacterium]|nr:ABC transporter permease [Elusimicrobiota bacterium]
MIRLYWKRLKQNRLALAGLGVIGLLALLALMAPHLVPHDPIHQDLLHRLEPPSRFHPIGTDDLGRDVLSRLVYGTRISLMVGFVAVGISVVIGTLLGLVAGYYGKWVDACLMRLVDTMLSVPTIFLILAVIAFLEPNIYNVMAVIGLTAWPGLTRLVRGECLSVRERDFVQAAKIVGLSAPRILGWHLLPNVIAPILVSATLGVGGAILTESALSFLGLGVQPPIPSWGNMLTLGRDYLHLAWWLSLFPGLAILITVLAFNLLGEGLRDVLDPRAGT